MRDSYLLAFIFGEPDYRVPNPAHRAEILDWIDARLAEGVEEDVAIIEAHNHPPFVGYYVYDVA